MTLHVIRTMARMCTTLRMLRGVTSLMPYVSSRLATAVTDKCAEKSGPETIYFRSNIYMITFNYDLSLKNCAQYGTLEGGLFRPRIYGNPELSTQIDRIAVDLRSPLVDGTRTRAGSHLKIDVHSRFSILISMTLNINV